MSRPGLRRVTPEADTETDVDVVVRLVHGSGQAEAPGCPPRGLPARPDPIPAAVEPRDAERISVYIRSREGPGFVFVAGSVGIMPLISHLRTMVDRQEFRPVVLFYGNSDWESSTFREELDALSRVLNLRVAHLLERPPEGWIGEEGVIDADVISATFRPSTEGATWSSGHDPWSIRWRTA